MGERPSREGAMTLEYRITIAGETHRIRVDVSTGQDESGDKELEAFVISTAYLEHYGYLPRFVVNALE
ncbi:MAG: hypothetical protein HY510_07840 [Acidobacteria bacterium]|nr:hypothetical protein [Acidobacteriota bacterium]